jgi:hypothetical protein
MKEEFPARIASESADTGSCRSRSKRVDRYDDSRPRDVWFLSGESADYSAFRHGRFFRSRDRVELSCTPFPCSPDRCDPPTGGLRCGGQATRRLKHQEGALEYKVPSWVRLGWQNRVLSWEVVVATELVEPTKVTERNPRCSEVNLELRVGL